MERIGCASSVDHPSGAVTCDHELASISILNFPELIFLRKEGETLKSLVDSPPKSVLLRWFNRILSINAMGFSEVSVTNFGSDIKDPRTYLKFLQNVLPFLNEGHPGVLQEGECRKRTYHENAAIVIAYAVRLLGPLTVKLSVDDILEGREAPNTIFVAQMLQSFAGICALSSDTIRLQEVSRATREDRNGCEEKKSNLLEERDIDVFPDHTDHRSFSTAPTAPISDTDSEGPSLYTSVVDCILNGGEDMESSSTASSLHMLDVSLSQKSPIDTIPPRTEISTILGNGTPCYIIGEVDSSSSRSMCSGDSLGFDFDAEVDAEVEADVNGDDYEDELDEEDERKDGNNRNPNGHQNRSDNRNFTASNARNKASGKRSECIKRQSEVHDTESVTDDLSVICQNWINPDNFRNIRVDELLENARDSGKCSGLALLELLDTVNPGVVKWKIVNKNPKSTFLSAENASYAINIARSMGLKIVNIGWLDIIDGKQKMVMAIISQLMRLYNQHVISEISEMNRIPLHAFSDTDVIRWANDRVRNRGVYEGGVSDVTGSAGSSSSSSGNSSQVFDLLNAPAGAAAGGMSTLSPEDIGNVSRFVSVKTLRDQNIKNGLYLIALIAAIREKMGSVDRVSTGDNDGDSTQVDWSLVGVTSIQVSYSRKKKSRSTAHHTDCQQIPCSSAGSPDIPSESPTPRKVTVKFVCSAEQQQQNVRYAVNLAQQLGAVVLVAAADLIEGRAGSVSAFLASLWELELKHDQKVENEKADPEIAT